VDTQEPIVPVTSAPDPSEPEARTAVGGTGGPEGGPGPARRRRLLLGAGVAVALLVATVVGAAFVRVPYFVLAPGSVRPTERYISVVGAPSFPDKEGEIGYTTVSLRRATALQAVVGWLDPTVDVVEEDLILGGQTQEENREQNLRDMTDSKEVATAVALETLGYDVTVTGTGAVVVEVLPDVPAASVLRPGDVVTAVDGRRVAVADELVAAVRERRPGEELLLTVERQGVADPFLVTVGLVGRPDEPTVAMLGVSISTRDLSFEFPFEVTVDSGSVGGPSAGLAFTLGIMDVLSPASLTGGTRVATTGTIDLDGNVGPVGGVRQKTVAVRRAGVDLFLVPSSEYEQALRYAGDMRVEPVDTIDDALEVLASVGGGTTALEARGPADRPRLDPVTPR
jgi:PDZ domain-containing protein